MSSAGVVACYGGSFDPPHVGHYLVASYVATRPDVRKVLLIPARVHAFGKCFGASYDDRVAMLRAMAIDLPRAEVCEVERELPDGARSVDVVEALTARMPRASLRWVLGTDLARETSRWHRFDDLVRLAPPLWVGRAGYPQPAGETLVEFPGISSTDLRKRLAEGEPTRALLPARVESLIAQRRLYGRPA